MSQTIVVPELLSGPDVARLVGRGRNMVWTWMTRGRPTPNGLVRLRTVKAAGTMLTTPAWLEEFCRATGLKMTADAI